MLLNSPYYLCHNFVSQIQHCSPLHSLQVTPKNFLRTGDKSFLYCDLENESNKTLIKQFRFKPAHKSKQFTFQSQSQISVVHDIEGKYTSFNIKDESALMLNRAGDLCYVNLINKNTFHAEKQHPGLYSDTEILSLEDSHYLTCGGCVKNSLTGQSQRIIKIWQIDQQQDSLQLKGRINTGHSKSIQYSFLVNQKVVSLSADKTIRMSNLSIQSVQRVIPVSSELYSGCQMDFNSIVVGGMSKNLQFYDLRNSKKLLQPIKIQAQPIQITKILRFDNHHLLVCCINELLMLDLRTLKLQSIGQYEGQRISDVLILDKQHFVIGNKEKTLQIWRAF